MESKNNPEKVTISMIKAGKSLTMQELDQINFHRQRVFETDDPYSPSEENMDWENLFILVKDQSEELLSFGRLHSIELDTSVGVREVYCVTSVVSVEPGKGYGKLVMDEIRSYVEETGITVLGFCETALLDFYSKCGYEVLRGEDNQFIYEDKQGKLPLGVVPGEVIYFEGRDKVMEEILKSSDKTVKIKQNHYE